MPENDRARGDRGSEAALPPFERAFSTVLSAENSSAWPFDAGLSVLARLSAQRSMR